MFKKFIPVVLIGFSFSASVLAEEATYGLKGVHCGSCVSAVQAKVCKDEFSECKAKVTNSKKELGELHLVTAKPEDKIDYAKIKAMVEEAGFELAPPPAAPKKPKI